MESLIADFGRCNSITWKNDSVFDIEYNPVEKGVYTKERIGAGSCLGEIFGIPTYLWDVSHDQYMFIDEDMVLDVSMNIPRTVLTLLRDENQCAIAGNCTIVVQQDHDRAVTHFFIITITEIDAGEEIVYIVPSQYRA